MKEQGRGKIVSITSIAACRSAPGMGIYGVAKAGIEMLTRVLAAELATDNIQVNAVAPCMVKTGFSAPFWSNEDVHAEIIKGIPMSRLAEVADIAHPLLFLCSGGADFITGQVLAVDGGATAV
jgi:2-deoxy-D-gluconate 3-dehydrogenase